jgi:hypothetical protein
MRILFIFLLSLSANAETINWDHIPMKLKIVTGKKIVWSDFTTNSSTTYKGYFGAVPDSSSGNLTRRMYFSESPAGEPLKQEFRPGKNACDVSGNEIKLSWSQQDKPNFITQCKLERNHKYYLNYQQKGFGGSKPNANSAFIRGASAK